MNLVFDTSILIDIERKNKDIIKKLNELKERYPAPPKISFITRFEFVYGLRNKNSSNKQKAISFLDLFSVMHTTNKTANILSDFKGKYELPLADLFIASQIYESDSVLITKDKDFEKIEEIEKII